MHAYAKNHSAIIGESSTGPAKDNTGIILLSAASPLEEAQQATSAASGSIRESYRRDVCISLNLNIFVTFMGRLDDMPHRQVWVCVYLPVRLARVHCVSPVCSENTTTERFRA
jgi:hypothetical protein